jgi:hypothetical protein
MGRYGRSDDGPFQGTVLYMAPWLVDSFLNEGGLGSKS